MSHIYVSKGKSFNFNEEFTSISSSVQKVMYRFTKIKQQCLLYNCDYLINWSIVKVQISQLKIFKVITIVNIYLSLVACTSNKTKRWDRIKSLDGSFIRFEQADSCRPMSFRILPFTVQDYIFKHCRQDLLWVLRVESKTFVQNICNNIRYN